MLRRMRLRNLTVFPEADLRFGRNLNVIVGENGSGKTHLLKAAYSVIAASAEEGRKASGTPTKTALQTKLADKLVGVFRPDTLGRLVRRRQGRERCEIDLKFSDRSLNTGFSFASNSKSEVTLNIVPEALHDSAPAYIPTRELLSIFPNFVSIYEGRYLEFEEIWRDTCLLLGAPVRRGPREEVIGALLEPLERAMSGKIVLERSGRFYLRSGDGNLEMPLVAEGLRKLGMLARLIASGVLLDKGYLFWDEPEANLNPRLVKRVAETILEISRTGVQVFLATHSLFLLRELEILLSLHKYHNLQARYFGLHPTENGIFVEQGTAIEEIGDIIALDESLEQSDRFLGMEAG